MTRRINRILVGKITRTEPTYNETIYISAFPHDESAWRIDWFGDIAYPNRAVRRKQPSVLVYLGQVAGNEFESDPTILLAPSCTRPTRFQRKVWISVGVLTLIRIGDIWRKGKLVLRPDYMLEKFDKVQIGKDSAIVMKAGADLGEGCYLLPLNEHPWHMQCTKSFCMVVQLADGRRIMIPCMELVRFYFGSSSGLLAKLFTPPLVLDSLWSNASMDPYAGELQMDLAEGISSASAPDIGRISMSKIAARAARMIGASCLQASVARRDIYPQAIFPFEGGTDLSAAGKWLTHGGVNNATFLVFNLRSCSHPFPFQSLQYTTKQTSLQGDTRKGQAFDRSQVRGASLPESKDMALVEMDASNGLARRLKLLHEAPRFLDLIYKYIRRRNADASASSEIGGRSSATSVDSAAVGDSGSGRRVRPMDISIADDEAQWNPHTDPRFSLRRTW